MKKLPSWLTHMLAVIASGITMAFLTGTLHLPVGVSTAAGDQVGAAVERSLSSDAAAPAASGH